VTIVRWPSVLGASPQRAAYQDFVERYKYKVTWTAFIDIDEFINLKKHSSIGEFLSDYPKAQGVGINWRVFGSSNKTEKIKSKRDGFRNLKTLNLTMDKYPDITVNKATNRAEVRVTYSMTYTTNNQITLTQNGIVETYVVSCYPNGKWLIIENIDEISAAGPPHPG
jgi:hypothetical protein